MNLLCLDFSLLVLMKLERFIIFSITNSSLEKNDNSSLSVLNQLKFLIGGHFKRVRRFFATKGCRALKAKAKTSFVFKIEKKLRVFFFFLEAYKGGRLNFERCSCLKQAHQSPGAFPY